MQALTAPDDPPAERLAWWFPLGCAIVAAAGFFVPYGLVPRPPPPEPPDYGFAAMDPFAEEQPYSPAAIARAKPLVDYHWFLPEHASRGHVELRAPAVSGRLPTWVVERFTRRSFSQIRACYQQGLRNNPNLQGRVSVRFVIGSDGVTSGVGNGGSDLPDAGVVSCIVRLFDRVTFPAPERGIAIVAYPIVLSP